MFDLKSEIATAGAKCVISHDNPAVLIKSSPHDFKHGANLAKKETTKNTSNITDKIEGSEQTSQTKHLRTDSAKLCYLHTRSSILEKTRKR